MVSAAMMNNAAPSTGARLLRNLRDLQLDDELDWPNIQAETFDVKDSVHNQAQRVRKAEWVVHNLLQIWDSTSPTAVEAAKLFPAYDPRQSLELRGVLFGHLSQLKKDGVFPKDLTLRKTMFDDCKGPKFEELLLSLSISVLLKVLDDDTADRSVLKELLLSESNPEIGTLQTFETSYRADLSHLLSGRANFRRRWQRFGRVLKMKEDEISQRRAAHERKVESSKQSRIPRRRLDRLQAHVEKDWQSSAEWRAILVRGDQHLPQKTLLERSYNEVWQHASEEKLYKIQPAGNKSALQKLEQQIDRQNQRLAKWRHVKIQMEKSNPRPPTPTQAAKAESHRSSQSKPDSRQSTKSPKLGTTPYEQTLQSTIDATYDLALDRQNAPERRSYKRSEIPDFSLPPPCKLATGPEAQFTRNSHELNAQHPMRSRPTSMIVQSDSKQSKASKPSASRPPIHHRRSQTVVFSPQVSARLSLDGDLNIRESIGSVGTESVWDNELLDFDDEEATNIINSALNVQTPTTSMFPVPQQPQPPSQHLSLTERARLSMAVPSSSPTKGYNPRPASSGRDSPPVREAQHQPSAPPPMPSLASLDERTRQTMAAMAAYAIPSSNASQPALQSQQSFGSHTSTSSSRPGTSRRTTVTKRTSRSPERRARAETPELSFVDESLLGENVDEDTIFMSRPKIAHSPQLNPVDGDEDSADVESVEDFS